MGAWEDLSDQFIRMVLMMILVDGIGDDDIIDDGIGDDDGGYELWVDLDLSDHFILIILVMVEKHTRHIIVVKMINDDDDDKSGRVLKDQKEDWIHP